MQKNRDKFPKTIHAIIMNFGKNTLLIIYVKVSNICWIKVIYNFVLTFLILNFLIDENSFDII